MKMKVKLPDPIPQDDVLSLGPEHLRCLHELAALHVVEAEIVGGIAYVKGLSNADFCCPVHWLRELTEFEEIMQAEFPDQEVYSYADMKTLWGLLK